MEEKYRLIKRGGTFYVHDRQTGQRTSLHTGDRSKAKRLLHAKNEAHIQPLLNTAVAKVYLAAQDPQLIQRTWGEVAQAYSVHGVASTKDRVKRAFKTAPFRLLFPVRLVETTSSHLEGVFKMGGSSTHNYIRRLHNLALRKGWLLQPIVHPADWPKHKPQSRRAITAEEHAQIVADEKDPERLLYYQMLWETGGAQSDVAALSWNNVNREHGMLIYHRKKTGEKCQLKMGGALKALLEQVPQEGDFFPKLKNIAPQYRATEFRRRCQVLKIKGVTLHCYRYAWAERAYSQGYPERFAQAALGHKTRAIHHAYARQADIVCPPLEEWTRTNSIRELPSGNE